MWSGVVHTGNFDRCRSISPHYAGRTKSRPNFGQTRPNCKRLRVLGLRSACIHQIPLCETCGSVEFAPPPLPHRPHFGAKPSPTLAEPIVSLAEKNQNLTWASQSFTKANPSFVEAKPMVEPDPKPVESNPTQVHFNSKTGRPPSSAQNCVRRAWRAPRRQIPARRARKTPR